VSATTNDPVVLRALLTEALDAKRDLEVRLAHAEEERRAVVNDASRLGGELMTRVRVAERRVERLEEALRRPHPKMIEAAAFELYAAGPWGTHAHLMGMGERCLTDSHSMEVYRRMVGLVLSSVLEVLARRALAGDEEK
jgi:hypothetical protein